MEIMLLEDVRNLGRRGDLVTVKPGYARNYLLPQRIALEATAGARAFFEQQKEKIDARLAREREQAAELAAKLAALKIQLAKRVGESETLYGSVTATEIAEQLDRQGIRIDKRHIDLHGGIKSLGEHTVVIDLHPEVLVELTVEVVPEE